MFERRSIYDPLFPAGALDDEDFVVVLVRAQPIFSTPPRVEIDLNACAVVDFERPREFVEWGVKLIDPLDD